MKKNTHPELTAQEDRVFSRGLVVLIVVGVLVIVLGLLLSPGRRNPGANLVSNNDPGRNQARQLPQAQSERPTRPEPGGAQSASAAEIVASKVNQFARNRHEIVRAIALRSKTQVPIEIEKFFAALEGGRWEEIEDQWKSLARQSGQYENSTHRAELDPFWPAVLDAYGVAEQARLWPAQKLLDYGNTILDSLRPGMVYVGGTDNGRWIPELLNETGGSEPHIMVTQNAFADARYLDFVNTLYGDRMTTLSTEDSQAAFQSYITDAQKRLEHDQQFPDEPKQVRPGEDIKLVDGKAQVSGAVSVMAINEKLLQTLMEKNPQLSFAVQESFPFKGTYADALPLGPLMELGAGDGNHNFTPERATQSLEYWQATAQQLLADPEAAGSPDTLKSYSHDAVAAAHLLAAHNFNSEAEQAYNLAAQLCPGNPEPVSGLADVLLATGRENEARQLLEDFAHGHPDAAKELQRISSLWHLIGTAQATTH